MVYLDHAATSFPKPKRVITEQAACMRHYCGNPGRGSHPLSLAAAEKIYECREEIASFFHSPHPENVIFTMNATMAINFAVKGLLREGDHVLLSDIEHNALRRPISKLAAAGKIEYTHFPSLASRSYPSAEEICAEIRKRIRPNTRMLFCAHASNVCPATLPIAEIGALCRESGILFAVDASQSAGHLPIDVEEMKIDALCAPGHKGLWGPQGTGFLILGEKLSADTLLEGGSGYHSLDAEMPQEPPERYEAGTLPTPAIAGLCEGIRYTKKHGIAQLHKRARDLCEHLRERLIQSPNVTLYGGENEGAILLFNVKGLPADATAHRLASLGFCLRAGYHCAPLAHATLGTPNGGAVRVSPAHCNTPSEIDALADAILDLCAFQKQSRVKGEASSASPV